MEKRTLTPERWLTWLEPRTWRVNSARISFMKGGTVTITPGAAAPASWSMMRISSPRLRG